MDDADPAGLAHLGDGRRGRPRDRVVAAEDDRDRAAGRRPRGPCGRSSREPRSSQAGTMLASPASTTVSTSSGSDVELERVQRAGVVRRPDRRRAEPRARAVRDRVVERRADDRDVHLLREQVRRIRDARQLVERRPRPDEGREVEIGVGLVRPVPPVAVREAPVGGFGLDTGPPRDVRPTRSWRHRLRGSPEAVRTALAVDPSTGRTSPWPDRPGPDCRGGGARYQAR